MQLCSQNTADLCLTRRIYTLSAAWTTLEPYPQPLEYLGRLSRIRALAPQCGCRGLPNASINFLVARSSGPRPTPKEWCYITFSSCVGTFPRAKNRRMHKSGLPEPT